MNININMTTPAAFFSWQRFVHVEVSRKTSELLQIDLFFLETSREDHIHVELFIKDFTINNAVLERIRPVSGAIRPLSLVFLRGKSIYLKEAKSLKEAILSWGETQALTLPLTEAGKSPPLAEREHFAGLFSEMISNVLQAEAFLYQERGVASLEEYDRFFSDLFDDTCILYRTPRGALPLEDVYTQKQQRFIDLFSRNRSVVISRPDHPEQSGDRAVQINVHFSDSFHEIALALRVLPFSDPPYLIEKAWGNFLRVPDLQCREAAGKLQELAGLSLLPAEKRKIISLLNGPEGCSHLCDMVMDAVDALQAFCNAIKD